MTNMEPDRPETRYADGSPSREDLWFVKEVEKSGRTSISPVNMKVTLVALIVLLATMTTAIGGMSLIMAKQYALSVAPLAVAACLIAFIGWALMKKSG